MVVTDWLPPNDRIKEVKGKRGWEKPDMTNSNAPGRQGGWVARNLIILMRTRDTKVSSKFFIGSLTSLNLIGGYVVSFKKLLCLHLLH